MVSSRRAAILALTVAALACGDATSGGDAPQWILTETLRIGTMEEGPASFGSIRSIAVDARGQVWVYDGQAADIRVFAPEGAHVRTVGRKGQGPGEFANAEGIAFAPDGRLWVRDATGARFSVFDREGTFEQSWPYTFCSRYGEWAPQFQGERILAEDCVVSGDRAVSRAIVGYRTDMSGADTLFTLPECGTKELQDAATFIREIPNGMRFWEVPWAPAPLRVLGAAGEIWCAPNSSRFEILRLVHGATDTLRIALEAVGAPVTAAERDSAIAGIEKDGPTGLDFGRIPSTKPLIDRLTVDDTGRLWVRRTAADGGIEFVIFSPEGTLLARAKLEGVRPGIRAPFVVRQDAVYTVILDHEEIPNVIRLDIAKPR